MPRLVNWLARSAPFAAGQVGRGRPPRAGPSPLREAHLQGRLLRRARRREPGRPRRSCSGRTPSRTTSTPSRRSQRSRCCRRWATAWWCPDAVAVLRTSALRLRLPRHGEAVAAEIVDELHEDIVAGVPVVGVEPSCVATFRDELAALLPGRPRSRGSWRDRPGSSASSWSVHRRRRAAPPRAARPSCTGTATRRPCWTSSADRRTLERLGVETDVPESGCCGMAGPFGFEADHYDVSQACGERVLLPAVRERKEGRSSSRTGSAAGRRSSRPSRASARSTCRRSCGGPWSAGTTEEVGRPRRAFHRACDHERRKAGR